mgnify:CR=1 FL=1
MAFMSEQNTVSFGFETVTPDEKVDRVKGVFRSVASKYDVMNDFMSVGIHRLWKHDTMNRVNPQPGEAHLDVAGGTGELARSFLSLADAAGKRRGDTRQATAIVCDINDAMLRVGRDKLRDKGIVSNVKYVQANAEALPFPDNSFDIITIAFGLRNVTDKDKALASMYRVLKPGGRLLVLEFSKPTSEVLNKVYDAYSFHLLPKIGELVAKDGDSYKYLAESIRMHPEQDVRCTAR